MTLAADVAALVPVKSTDVTIVAIDGVDGSGKTTFAAALGEELRRMGRQVVDVHLDDFHHVSAVRHQRGRHSPEGFFLDSYDYAAFTDRVVAPLRAGGHRIRTAASDLERDVYIDPGPVDVPPGAVVLVEGIFAHRDELFQLWDWSIFLDVPFEVSVARMAVRDGSPNDPDHSAVRRYVEGQRLYLAQCDPKARASIVIDNS